MIKDNEKRNVSIMKDADGNKIALIHEIIFSVKRNINWEEVELHIPQELRIRSRGTERHSASN